MSLDFGIRKTRLYERRHFPLGFPIIGRVSNIAKYVIYIWMSFETLIISSTDVRKTYVSYMLITVDLANEYTRSEET